MEGKGWEIKKAMKYAEILRPAPVNFKSLLHRPVWWAALRGAAARRAAAEVGEGEGREGGQCGLGRAEDRRG